MSLKCLAKETNREKRNNKIQEEKKGRRESTQRSIVDRDGRGPYPNKKGKMLLSLPNLAVLSSADKGHASTDRTGGHGC
jgi:hypothetical protein